jgi:disulfide bond formation protein DsbB
MNSLVDDERPWEEGRLSKTKMFLVRFGSLLSFVVSFFAGIFGAVWLMFDVGGDTPDYTVPIIALVVMSLAIFGSMKLSPLVRNVPNFTPSYGLIPVGTRGQQYEVRFQNDWLRRSFTGKGVVRFADEGLVIFGSLGLPIWMLAGFLAFVALIVWLVVNLMLSVGIGFLVVVLVSGLGRLWYIKRTTRAFTYSYSDVTSIRMQRRVVTLELNGMPKVVNFVLSKTDGERFYREYVERLPIVSLSASSVR